MAQKFKGASMMRRRNTITKKMFKNEEIHNLNREDIEQGKLIFNLASPKGSLVIRQEKKQTNEFYIKDAKKNEMKHEKNL